LCGTVGRGQDDCANYHNRAASDDHALTTDAMADDEAKKATNCTAYIVDRSHCKWSGNEVSGRLGLHTNSLHRSVWVIELLSKLIIGSNQSTHNSLIISQEKKGLTAGRCINQYNLHRASHSVNIPVTAQCKYFPFNAMLKAFTSSLKVSK
jgi:hypothetical protein